VAINVVISIIAVTIITIVTAVVVVVVVVGAAAVVLLPLKNLSLKYRLCLNSFYKM
jgi:hypothetical protein